MRSPGRPRTVVLTLLALLAVGCSSSPGAGGGGGDAGGEDVGEADAVAADRGGSDAEAKGDKGMLDPGPGADPGVGDTANMDTAGAETAGLDVAEGEGDAVGDAVEDAGSDSGANSDIVEETGGDVAGDGTGGDAVEDAGGDTTEDAGVIAGANCGDPIEITALPFAFFGDTTGVSNDFDAAGCAGIDPSSSGAASSDMVFTFTAPAEGHYTFELAERSPGVDAILAVFDACPSAAAAACAAADNVINSAPAGGGESLTQTLASGQTVYILVDGYSSGNNESGLFRLLVSRSDEICDDKIDNDTDSFTDCSDSDCFTSPVCTGEGDICSTALNLSGALPITATGNTLATMIHDNYQPAMCDAGGLSTSSADVVYTFTPASDGTYRFKLNEPGTAFDSLLYLATACPPTTDTCLGMDDEFGKGGDLIEAALTAAQTVYVFVDGDHDSSFGAYSLTVDLIEALCDDGADNDGDSLTDCDDSDCKLALNCVQAGEICEKPLDLSGALPITVTGDTTLFDNAYEPCTGASIYDASEVVFAFQAPAAGDYVFGLNPAGTDYDSYLFLSSGCPPSTGNCLGTDNAFPGNGGESIQVTLAMGERVYIYVDASSLSTGSSLGGSFQLEVEAGGQ